MRDEGVRIEWESPIVRRIWEKVMVNCAINPLTALLRIRNGELLRSDEALSLMESVVEEAVSVARAEGVGLEADAVLKRVVEV
ncbi:ketopantoate reductase C-terminal domain-containing protein, partial [Clostridium boliviensis]|uniref:ketopantoate reductase C-terminal domain-containing protein n=1 Tax=Clostridium boliviensis TaxID=318465 RepID=UPI0029654B50